MTAPTHIAFGLLSAASTFSLASVSLHKDMPALGCAILGSLLPDIDTPGSSVGRLLPFVSVPLERRWGHRTITHCLLALLAVGVAAMPLMFYRSPWFAALMIGYASHLVADCATKSGAPLFYPSPSICVFPSGDRYRIRTGSLLGEGILLAVLLVLLAALMPVSRVGGIWRASRYLIATPRTAWADYREATTEAVLRFEGRWQDTRKPVTGEAVVLDATQDWFLIAFQGATRIYGDLGDIIPDKSRVRETGRPIRVDTLEAQRQTLDQILDRAPEGCFLSGRLESGSSFRLDLDERLSRGRHTAVRVFGRDIQFRFAPRAQVALLRPEAFTSPERVAELRSEIRDLQADLSAMQLRRPPVHYLRLQGMRDRLQARQRLLDLLLHNRQVRFSGHLSLRIPGKEK